MGTFAEVGSSVLLYLLVFGMSATVDIAHLRKQLRNRNALLTGISLQFVILPFIGFVVVKALDMSAPTGIALLVVTSSPGGSYSNWWCSMFNADLALSVTMTAISTLLSVIMLPVNLIIYATGSYSSAVVKSLDWSALFLSLVVVIGGISSGLICSAKLRSHKFNLMANKLGNIAGISLVTYSILISSSDHQAQLWDQDLEFYFGIASPCVIGLSIATWMASRFKLEKPERVAVAVESCYQNTGIATSVAITMFEGDDLAAAVGVPLFYGICEAFVLAIYCLGAWKLGWTKAPKDESLCVVIAKSYEVEEAKLHDPDAIEVVLGLPKEGGLPSDLVFSSTEEGYEIDEVSLNSISTGDTPDLPEKEITPEISALETNDLPDHVPLGGTTYTPLGMECPSTSEGGALRMLHLPPPSSDSENERDVRRVGTSDTFRFRTRMNKSGKDAVRSAVASLRARGSGKYKKGLKTIDDSPAESEKQDTDRSADDGRNYEFPPAPSTNSNTTRVSSWERDSAEVHP